jgi:beta-glucosidase
LPNVYKNFSFAWSPAARIGKTVRMPPSEFLRKLTDPAVQPIILSMSTRGFPQGFLWGAATAAYQIEGAVREDGRGESIWDRFCATPGAIRGGDVAAVACDHYHRWKHDVENMRDLGLTSYRFSVSWPRLFPQGHGRLNRKGLDFYSALVDGLLAARVQPALTLYHWDLPQTLQDAGGWANRDTASWFADYAECLYAHLGDRVKMWITINEPHVVAFHGHSDGVHAPGVRDFGTAVQVAHVLLHAHALAVAACRQVCPADCRIGIALDLHPMYPLTDGTSDVEATRRADGKVNRWFLDALLKGSYPGDVLETYAKHNLTPRIESHDLAALVSNAGDFIGVNYYFPHRVYANDAGGVLGFEYAKPADCMRTDMGWEVYPEGLCDLLIRLKNDYADPMIIISENGAAYPDRNIEKGQVQDNDRIDYLASHLHEALRAIDHGVKLRGYFLWSLLDNFQWSMGFSKRFGITHVDYHTQGRTWKKSASWYQSVIAANGANLG